MIRTLVDFALNNKFVVLAVAALLTGWGIIAFRISQLMDLIVKHWPRLIMSMSS